MAERRQREEADRIMRLRSAGISSQEFRNARFALDDGQAPGPVPGAFTPYSVCRGYLSRYSRSSFSHPGTVLPTVRNSPLRYSPTSSP